jgi:hypothetical protein
MRIFIAAMTIALLTVPAYPQAGAGRGGDGKGTPTPEPKVDQAKQKAEEKAFKDAINRIPAPEKKYDPWGIVRPNGK